MTDREYVQFLNKCASIPHNDYSWLKDHCYRTLNRPCSPNTRKEHLAILGLIREHEERQWTPVSERLPEKDDQYLICSDDGEYNLDYFCRGAFSYSGVIAWMPLPAPYKVESEECIQ